MKKLTTKTLSLLLSIIMVFSVFTIIPFTASAESETITTAEGTKYQLVPITDYTLLQQNAMANSYRHVLKTDKENPTHAFDGDTSREGWRQNYGRPFSSSDGVGPMTQGRNIGSGPAAGTSNGYNIWIQTGFSNKLRKIGGIIYYPSSSLDERIKDYAVSWTDDDSTANSEGAYGPNGSDVTVQALREYANSHGSNDMPDFSHHPSYNNNGLISESPELKVEGSFTWTDESPATQVHKVLLENKVVDAKYVRFTVESTQVGCNSVTLNEVVLLEAFPQIDIIPLHHSHKIVWETSAGSKLEDYFIKKYSGDNDLVADNGAWSTVADADISKVTVGDKDYYTAIIPVEGTGTTDRYQVCHYVETEAEASYVENRSLDIQRYYKIDYVSSGSNEPVGVDALFKNGLHIGIDNLSNRKTFTGSEEPTLVASTTGTDDQKKLMGRLQNIVDGLLLVTFTTTNQNEQALLSFETVDGEYCSVTTSDDVVTFNALSSAMAQFSADSEGEYSEELGSCKPVNNGSLQSHGLRYYKQSRKDWIQPGNSFGDLGYPGSGRSNNGVSEYKPFANMVKLYLGGEPDGSKFIGTVYEALVGEEKYDDDQLLEILENRDSVLLANKIDEAKAYIAENSGKVGTSSQALTALQSAIQEAEELLSGDEDSGENYNQKINEINEKLKALTEEARGTVITLKMGDGVADIEVGQNKDIIVEKDEKERTVLVCVPANVTNITVTAKPAAEAMTFTGWTVSGSDSAVASVLEETSMSNTTYTYEVDPGHPATLTASFDGETAKPGEDEGALKEFKQDVLKSSAGQAANSFDGNNGTYWTASNVNVNNPARAEITLGSHDKYYVGGVTFTARLNASNQLVAAAAKDYSIYVSDDNRNWVLAKSGTLTFDSEATDSVKSETVYFDSPYQAKYMRIDITKTDSGLLEIPEIKVHEFLGEKAETGYKVKVQLQEKDSEGQQTRLDKIQDLEIPHYIPFSSMSEDKLTDTEFGDYCLETDGLYDNLFKNYNNYEWKYTIGELKSNEEDGTYECTVECVPQDYSLTYTVDTIKITLTTQFNKLFSEITGAIKPQVNGAKYWADENGTVLCTGDTFELRATSNYVAVVHMNDLGEEANKIKISAEAPIVSKFYDVNRGWAWQAQILVTISNIYDMLEDGSYKYKDNFTDFGLIRVASGSGDIEEAKNAINSEKISTSYTSDDSKYKVSSLFGKFSLTSRGRYMYTYKFTSMAKTDVYAYVVVDGRTYITETPVTIEAKSKINFSDQ